MILNFIQEKAAASVPSASEPLLVELSKWVSGSTAASVSFALNVLSFLLAIAGFALYFRQKREYWLLFSMLDEYGIKQRVTLDTKNAKQKHEEAKSELAAAKAAIEEAKSDLEERLPMQARRAYLENTIPIIEEQVGELNERLAAMHEDLAKYSDAKEAASPQIAQILNEEVRRHIDIRRRLDTAQSNLTVLTGLAAATGALPLFMNDFALLPVFGVLGVLIFTQSLHIFILYRRYYRGRGMRFSRRPKAAPSLERKSSI